MMSAFETASSRRHRFLRNVRAMKPSAHLAQQLRWDLAQLVDLGRARGPSRREVACRALGELLLFSVT